MDHGGLVYHIVGTADGDAVVQNPLVAIDSTRRRPAVVQGELRLSTTNMKLSPVASLVSWYTFFGRDGVDFCSWARCLEICLLAAASQCASFLLWGAIARVTDSGCGVNHAT